MKQVYTIELEERQQKFLEEMVEKYRLPSVDKAVRCLIDMVVSEPEQQEKAFEEIRCLDC